MIVDQNPGVMSPLQSIQAAAQAALARLQATTGSPVRVAPTSPGDIAAAQLGTGQYAPQPYAGPAAHMPPGAVMAPTEPGGRPTDPAPPIDLSDPRAAHAHGHLTGLNNALAMIMEHNPDSPAAQRLQELIASHAANLQGPGPRPLAAVAAELEARMDPRVRLAQLARQVLARRMGHNGYGPIEPTMNLGHGVFGGSGMPPMPVDGIIPNVNPLPPYRIA